MNVNYTLLGVVLFLAIALIVFLIVRNNKDKKKFEADENQSGLPPEQHEDERERI